MRVVVDANVLISALISPYGLEDTLYQLWLAKRFNLVTSEWQLDEIRRVSRYEHLSARFKPHRVGRLINGLRKSALVLNDLPNVAYSADPDDNPIISAAIAGRAQYIVSGDKSDVQALGKIVGVRVVTTREFVGQFVKLVE